MANKKLLVIMLVFWLTTLLASAGSSGTCSAAGGADPKETVIKACQMMQEQKSYHMALGLTAAMTVQGKNMNLVLDSELDCQVKPVLIKNLMTIIITADGRKSVESILQYVEPTGDHFSVYSNVNNRWVKQSMPNYSPSQEYENYFKAIKSVTPLRETDDATVYEVTADGSYLRENIQRMMASAGTGNVRLPLQLLTAVGDFTYTVFIDKKTGFISEIYMDLSDFLRAIGGMITQFLNLPENQKTGLREMFSNSKMIIDISFSQFNAVGQIQIPQEARDANSNSLPQPDKSAVLPQTSLAPSTIAGGATIKIGCNLELSSGIARFGQEALNGARLAVKDVNDAGGIFGRKVELIELDNASDPAGRPPRWILLSPRKRSSR